MSISSSGTRKSGPYAGNGGTTAFPFAFKVFQASDVLVVQTDTTPADHTLALNTDYTVALNPNQDANPGGTVNMAVAPPSGYLLTIGSNVPELQSVTLTNNGGFYPTVINTALDYLTILIQQLSEKVGRALVMPFSTNASGQLPPVAPGQLLGWKADGTGIDNVGASGVGAGSIVASNMAAGATGTALSVDTRAANGKAAPADADLVPLFDSANFWYLKGLTWANLKAALLAYFNGVYLTLSSAAATYLTISSAAATYQPLGTSAVIGDTRNLKCSIPSASASATFAADEVVVGSGLGATAYKLGSYSELLDLTKIGAGGMDQGTAPAGGFVAIYAIAQAGGASPSILACNVATSEGPVYSGANMPGGYAVSALLGIVPTNASAQMAAGLMLARKFNYTAFSAVYTGHADISALTMESISAQVPAAAKYVDLMFVMPVSGTSFGCVAAADSSGTGARVGSYVASAVSKVIGGVTTYGAVGFENIPIAAAQTVAVAQTSGSANNALYVSGYGW